MFWRFDSPHTKRKLDIYRRKFPFHELSSDLRFRISENQEILQKS